VAGYPRRETFFDCAGVARAFEISAHGSADGYTLVAAEVQSGGGGYKFRAYHPNAVHLAAGLLRDRIRRGLATKFLAHTERGPEFSHDRDSGTIAADGAIIDGTFLSPTEFFRILGQHEGHCFTLTLSEL
jgi:hypothetical protein